MATKKKTTETSKKPTKGQVRQVVRDKKNPDNPAMTLLNEVRKHGGITYLCDFIRSCKLLKMSDDDILHELKKRYGIFLSELTKEDFKVWLRNDPDIERAYFAAYEAIGGRALDKIYDRLADNDKADNEFLLTVVEKFVNNEESTADTKTLKLLEGILSGLRG